MFIPLISPRVLHFFCLLQLPSTVRVQINGTTIRNIHRKFANAGKATIEFAAPPRTLMISAVINLCFIDRSSLIDGYGNALILVLFYADN